MNKITNVDWTPRPTVRVFFFILNNDDKIAIGIGDWGLGTRDNEQLTTVRAKHLENYFWQ
ncbi:MAG: hypothetical protein JHC73_02205 [Dolichospermum sp.]|nr:hypothetical protein [Dolichospermum sp.]